MATIDAALRHAPAGLLRAAATASTDHTPVFLLGALALIVAAAGWLAFEVHRIWSADADDEPEGSRRRRAEDDHPLVPQLVEEIIRLNALVAELRAAREESAGAPNDADLASWARAQPAHAQGLAAHLGHPSA